eukprot:2081811-Amphidinium_carterae.1
MDQEDTVATLTSVDVGLAMSLILEKGLGWPFQAAGNLSLELNSWRLCGALEECQPSRVVSDWPQAAQRKP